MGRPALDGRTKGLDHATFIIFEMMIVRQILFLFLKFFVVVLLFQMIRIGVLIFSNSRAVRETRPYQQNPSQPKSKILVIGDSTAVGVGSTDPKLTIAGRLGMDFPNAEIKNLGVSGLRIDGLVKQFDPKLIGHYDLIIIQIGANDIIHLTPLIKVKPDLNQLLTAAKTVSNQIVILHSGNVGLAPFFPSCLEFIWRQRSLEMRALYQQTVEQYGAVYVDLFTERQEDIFLKDIQKYYSPDLLHPSSEGYGIWYTKIRQSMKEKGVVLP